MFVKIAEVGFDEFREAVRIHWFKNTFLLLSPSCHDGKSPAAVSRTLLASTTP